MISTGVVVVSVGCFLFGFITGLIVRDAAGSDNVVRRWIELRHEFRLKVLAQRERWLEVDAARPRPGEYRTETRETPR